MFVIKKSILQNLRVMRILLVLLKKKELILANYFQMVGLILSDKEILIKYLILCTHYLISGNKKEAREKQVMAGKESIILLLMKNLINLLLIQQ